MRFDRRSSAAFGIAVAIAVAIGSVLATSTASLAQTTTIINSAVLPPVSGEDPTVFSRPGPYGVGVRTLTVGSGSTATKAELWYPIEPGAKRTTTYDLKQWLPDAQRKRLASKSVATFATSASRDAAPSTTGGPFPVVLFSHGFAGFRLQSAFLTTHLASWGFAVAAPDHRDRDFAAVLSGSMSFGSSSDVNDLAATVRALRTMQLGQGPFRGRLDVQNLSAVGHSAGANAALKYASRESNVLAVVGLAGGTPGMLGTIPALRTPVLWMSATNDGVVTAASVRAAFDAADVPRRLVEVGSSGHLAFADLCTVGRDRGGVFAIAAKEGIAIPALVKRLGTDGCIAPNAPVDQAFPVIRHAVVAQLRTVLGGGTPGFGLDQATFDALASSGAVKSRFLIG